MFALLSETWLRPGQQFYLPSFNIVRSDRLDGYGGVAIAAHQSIQIKEIPITIPLKNHLSCHSIDLVGIEAFINSNRSLILWSLYIPPSSNPSMSLLNYIFQLIGPNSILGGDVNGHHPLWDNNNCHNHRGDCIHASLSNLNLCCLNSGAPTRVNRPPFSNTAVDITLSTNALFWSLSWFPLDDPHGSDHFPIIIEHHASSSPPLAASNQVPTLPKMNYSKAD
jgi:exonuclease III